jgi:hypothetical protein
LHPRSVISSIRDPAVFRLSADRTDSTFNSMTAGEQREEEVFAGAVQLPPAQRGAYYPNIAKIYDAGATGAPVAAGVLPGGNGDASFVPEGRAGQ